MGMAIKSELADTGFDVWEAWSLQADSFNGKDARDVWKSIRAGGKVTIGTLFYEAKAKGWRDDGGHQMPTPEKLAERRRIAAELAAKEDAEIARERADTAKKAAAILKAATEAKADHPYLSRKRVSPVATLREIDAGTAAAILGYPPKSGGDALAGRLLVVPVKQGDGISTLELIDGDKRKAALAGRGSKVGGYWATERLPDGDGSGLTLLIGEGVATVLSASAATGKPGIAALSAGNLPAVAKSMRERYPTRPLIFLADLVKATGEPNPHAIEAARAVGGLLAIPDFGSDRPAHATDFNDLHQSHGLDAVKRAIASASAPAMAEPQPGTENAVSRFTDTVELIDGASIKPEAVRWLWEGYLARGKLHVLAGAPGTGKTMIALALAATVSTGGRWPDGTHCEPGNVLIWSAEDDIADTLVPRLIAMGADMHKIRFVGDKSTMEGRTADSFSS